MDDIARIRRRIDELDQEMLQLLKKRYENARLLGRIKYARGLEFHDLEREKGILRKVEHAAAKLDLDPKLVRRIFNQVFTFSIKAQMDQRDDSIKKLEQTRILIVGGTGGMGRFFANFTSLQGASVKIAGRTVSQTRRVAKEIDVKPGSIQDARTSDIVVVAVPLESMKRVCLDIAMLMKDGSLLIDLSSVKKGIADKISSKIPQGIEYVSLHPLFAPDIDHVYGESILAIVFRSGPQWRKFSQVLERAGARFQLTTTIFHDRAMAYVQALHHFALISLGVGLEKWDGRFKTNSIRATERSIRRILRNWETVIGIQQLNPYSQTVRTQFAKSTNSLSKSLPAEEERSRRILASNVQKWSGKT